MTLTPHDSIDIIERIIKSYRYDYEKDIDREEESQNKKGINSLFYFI